MLYKQVIRKLKERKLKFHTIWTSVMYTNIHFRTPSDSMSIIISCEADFALKSRDQLSWNPHTLSHSHTPTHSLTHTLTRMFEYGTQTETPLCIQLHFKQVRLAWYLNYFIAGYSLLINQETGGAGTGLACGATETVIDNSCHHTLSIWEKRWKQQACTRTYTLLYL
jgi:hypothetical protein